MTSKDGCGLSPLVDEFEHPKCKFGLNSMIVDATYVKCTMKPPGYYDKEDKGDLKFNCL
jgi:hypothetical protein